MKYFRKNSTTCLCFGPRKLEIFWTTGIVVGFLLGKLLGRGIWDVLWVSSTSPTPYESPEQVSKSSTSKHFPPSCGRLPGFAAEDNVAGLLRCVVLLVRTCTESRKLEERRNAFGELLGWSTRRLGQSCPVPKVPCNSVSVSIISKGKQEHGKGTNLKHLNGRTEQEMSSEAGPMSQ